MRWRAQWITARPNEAEPKRMPVFRRRFTVDGEIRNATAHISGLGHFELRVNDRKAGDDVLEPGWTDYDKRVLYVVHDVTSLLKPGENTLDVLLGNGMYNVLGDRYKKFKRSFGRPMLLMQLVIELADDRMIEVASDDTWQAAPGPITFSCIYGGEDHDAQLESPTAWSPVDITDGPKGQLQLQASPPQRVIESFTGQPIGNGVYDCGQNLSGRPTLRVQGDRGATVKLTPAEQLDAAGNAWRKHIGSPVYFTYTLRGGDSETWRPRFSLDGFRFVQVETTGNVTIESVGSEWIHAAAPVAGTFECSNEQLNRIHRLILAAIRSNTHSVSTDCPHREKLGWLEQLHLMFPGMVANFDLSTFLPKVLADIRDAQQDDGMIPTIAPRYTSWKPPYDVFNDSPEWGSAGVLVPWYGYQQYGDRELLSASYESMKRYVAYLASRATSHLIEYGLGDWYDIGPAGPGKSQLTSLKVTGTCTYYADLVALANTAGVLGHADDAERYGQLARNVCDAFNAAVFDPAKGFYDTGSQTAQAMPLALDMVPDRYRGSVVQQLVDDIRARQNHISAGDVGFPYVLQALAQAGRSDVVMDLLMRNDPPSYGSQLLRGNTALSEAWDAEPTKSQNHLMLGHVEQWFYESLGGITVDHTRNRCAIRIAPVAVNGVDWVRVERRCTFGAIVVHSRIDAEHVSCRIELPAGAEAELFHIGGDGPERISAGTHERRWRRA
jgi:hypothetical protein